METKWKGTLTFDPAKPNALTDKVVTCEFEIKIDSEGGISGFYKDGDYYPISEKMAAITGFIDEKFLSIVAHFPTRGLYNTEGVMYLDPNQLNHEMAFYGELNEEEDLMTGNWEVVERTSLDLDSLNVFYTCGFFEVKKLD